MRREARRDERDGVVGESEIRDRRAITYSETGFDGDGEEERDLRYERRESWEDGERR